MRKAIRALRTGREQSIVALKTKITAPPIKWHVFFFQPKANSFRLCTCLEGTCKSELIKNGLCKMLLLSLILLLFGGSGD